MTHYDTYNFTVDAVGMYDFLAMGPADLTAAVYIGSFDPNNPCTNLVEYNDDGNNAISPLDPRLMFTVSMAPGNYILVTSTFFNGETSTYEWMFEPPAGANVLADGPVVCPVEEDPIPTMSEWGLMIFGLLTLNMGLITIRRKEALFTL